MRFPSWGWRHYVVNSNGPSFFWIAYWVPDSALRAFFAGFGFGSCWKHDVVLSDKGITKDGDLDPSWEDIPPWQRYTLFAAASYLIRSISPPRSSGRPFILLRFGGGLVS